MHVFELNEEELERRMRLSFFLQYTNLGRQKPVSE